jgi:DNA replication and repair protein RecF
MEIHELSLSDFRSHAESTFSFGPGLNLLHGANGAGKTNVLEGIHYLCLGKSFRTSSDRNAVRIGCRSFQIHAAMLMDTRGPSRARMAWSAGEGKRIDVGGAPLDRLVDVVGRFPLVVMAPSDHKLTEEGPDERRRFLDMLLCQASPTYVDDLMRYRRILKQRNQLLSRRPDLDLLRSFDAPLAKAGAGLVIRRSRFVASFSSFLDEAFSLLATGTERPSIAYRSFREMTDADDASSVENSLLAALEERRDREIERGVTSVGPHRDDLDFRLDDLSVRRFASQGQHRTFVIGLKLAEYFYLADRLGERPLLLLDDVFDTLDPDRVRIFAHLLLRDEFGQSIVTAARRDVLDADVPFDGTRSRAITVLPTAPVDS